MFHTKFVSKIKTHMLCAITFSPNIVPFLRTYGKIWYSQIGHRW